MNFINPKSNFFLSYYAILCLATFSFVKSAFYLSTDFDQNDSSTNALVSRKKKCNQATLHSECKDLKGLPKVTPKFPYRNSIFVVPKANLVLVQVFGLVISEYDHFTMGGILVEPDNCDSYAEKIIINVGKFILIAI